MYASHASNLEDGKGPKFEDNLALWELQDVFTEEVLGFPPNKNIDFTINIFLRITLVSNTPYKMRTPKLLEMKMKLHVKNQIFK